MIYKYTMQKISLKDYLQLRGVSVQEAAAELGITRAHMHNLCKGEAPSRELAIKIWKWSAKVIKPSHLLGLPE